MAIDFTLFIQSVVHDALGSGGLPV